MDVNNRYRERDYLSWVEETQIEQEESPNFSLASWTARDFSQFYVRFRPSLINHARKFLGSSSQVDDVVQEAFLYLMTSLPELDSEVGVLRYLKWKVRGLCLDQIRASKVGKVHLTNVEDFSTIGEADSAGHNLERADELAVVNLALASLNERHRKVIVDEFLLEKPIREVAQELKLSENALRQLAWRARRAFKASLEAEVEKRGLTISDLLSTLGRKARESVIVGRTGVMALVLAVILLTPSLLNFENRSSETADLPLDTPLKASEELPRIQMKPEEIISAQDSSSSAGDLDSFVDLPSEKQGDSGQLSVASTSEDGQELITPVSGKVAASAGAVDSPSRRIEDQVSKSLTKELTAKLASTAQSLHSMPQPYLVEVESTSGLRAFVGLSPQENTRVEFLYFTFTVGDSTLVAVPQRTLERYSDDQGAQSVHIGALDFVVGDFEGKMGNSSVDATALLRLGVEVSLVFDEMGSVIESNLTAVTLGTT